MKIINTCHKRIVQCNSRKLLNYRWILLCTSSEPPFCIVYLTIEGKSQIWLKAVTWHWGPSRGSVFLSFPKLGQCKTCVYYKVYIYSRMFTCIYDLSKYIHSNYDTFKLYLSFYFVIIFPVILKATRWPKWKLFNTWNVIVSASEF